MSTKKMVPLCILLIIHLIGCKDDSKGKISSQSIKDSSLGLRDSLLGKWGGSGESKPVWDIRKDSIYYFERSVAYPYKIINRDFIIYFPDHKGLLRKIRVDHDTIFFYDDMGLVKGYRFKK